MSSTSWSSRWVDADRCLREFAGGVHTAGRVERAGVGGAGMARDSRCCPAPGAGATCSSSSSSRDRDSAAVLLWSQRMTSRCSPSYRRGARHVASRVQLGPPAFGFITEVPRRIAGCQRAARGRCDGSVGVGTAAIRRRRAHAGLRCTLRCIYRVAVEAARPVSGNVALPLRAAAADHIPSLPRRRVRGAPARRPTAPRPGPPARARAQHNSAHCPPFKTGILNRLFFVALTLWQGAPVCSAALARAACAAPRASAPAGRHAAVTTPRHRRPRRSYRGTTSRTTSICRRARTSCARRG